MILRHFGVLVIILSQHQHGMIRCRESQISFDFNLACWFLVQNGGKDACGI